MYVCNGQRGGPTDKWIDTYITVRSLFPSVDIFWGSLRRLQEQAGKLSGARVQEKSWAHHIYVLGMEILLVYCLLTRITLDPIVVSTGVDGPGTIQVHNAVRYDGRYGTTKGHEGPRKHRGPVLNGVSAVPPQ